MYTVKAHDEIINSIDGVGGLNIGEGAPEIVTGSRDGECGPNNRSSIQMGILNYTATVIFIDSKMLVVSH